MTNPYQYNILSGFWLPPLQRDWSYISIFLCHFLSIYLNQFSKLILSKSNSNCFPSYKYSGLQSLCCRLPNPPLARNFYRDWHLQCACATVQQTLWRRKPRPQFLLRGGNLSNSSCSGKSNNCHWWRRWWVDIAQPLDWRLLNISIIRSSWDCLFTWQIHSKCCTFLNFERKQLRASVDLHWHGKQLLLRGHPGCPYYSGRFELNIFESSLWISTNCEFNMNSSHVLPFLCCMIFETIQTIYFLKPYHLMMSTNMTKTYKKLFQNSPSKLAIQNFSQNDLHQKCSLHILFQHVSV